MLLLIIWLKVLLFANVAWTKTTNPIIGVLSQELFGAQRKNFTGYIAASYVKLVESGGGRVIPIWIGQDVEYYRRVVQYTNGLLLPGGAAYFNQTDGFAEAGRHLYRFALEANEKGDSYPIFGICLGMELLFQLPLGRDDESVRVDCSAHQMALPLDFQEGYKNSELFSDAPEYILDILATKNVTYNYHRFCVTTTIWRETGLEETWRILATNRDKNGLEFISAFDSPKHPFYGVQFHPEKNAYEFKNGKGYPHSKEAVLVTQHFANFFVEKARSSNHSFPDWNTEQAALIYNHDPYFSGKLNDSFEQRYMFRKDDFVQVF